MSKEGVEEGKGERGERYLVSICYIQVQDIVLDFFYEQLVKKFYVKQLIVVVLIVVVTVAHHEEMLESLE
jgi:hypothetical protein